MCGQIARDPCIAAVYRRIEAYEETHGKWAHHGMTHVAVVSGLVEVVLKSLNCDAAFVEEANAAALLHEESVLQAILRHSDGFDSPDLRTLALILCDKLDITHARVAKAGLRVEGMLQYIEDVRLSMDERALRFAFRFGIRRTGRN